MGFVGGHVASYCEVFERKEQKYRLNAGQYRKVICALAGHMEPDSFGATRVTSLYFDTPDRLLIERSLEKPLYKEKLRLRCYGDDPDEGTCAFVEIKKKYKGVVYKRRVGMSYAAARAYLSGVSYVQACEEYPLADAALQKRLLAVRSLQIAREIDAFRARYETLVPSMSISCKRTAYAPLDVADEGLRVTFDEGISYLDCFARQEFPHLLLPEGEVVMEVKNVGPLPLWLADALAAASAYPSSFSKYGYAYRLCQEIERAASA